MDTISLLKQLRDAGALDGVLGGIGLETRNNPLVKLVLGVGILAAGALLGAGAGLALAPATGEQMRVRAKDKVDGLRGKLAQARTQKRGTNNRYAQARSVAGTSKNTRKSDV